jgi:hypothetical protein
MVKCMTECGVEGRDGEFFKRYEEVSNRLGELSNSKLFFARLE